MKGMQTVRSTVHNLIGASIALSVLGLRSAFASVFGGEEPCT